MAILSGKAIRARLDAGDLVVTGVENPIVNPASIDIHLGDRITCFKYSDKTVIDSTQLEDPARYEQLLPDGRRFIWHVYTDEFIGSDPFIVHPNVSILGISKEKIKLPADLGSRFYQKSELLRLGLMVESAASWAQWLDPGFDGDLRVILKNIGWLPIKIYPGMIIGRLVFEEVKDAPLD